MNKTASAPFEKLRSNQVNFNFVRLDTKALVGAALLGIVFVLVQQIAQGIHQVAAHGAAQTAAVEQHHVFLTADHELVVEADLAELVDDHRGVAHLRQVQQMVQHRGLAAAEKAGQQRDGNGLIARFLLSLRHL